MFLTLFNLEGFVVLGVWLCSPICMAFPSYALSPTPCVMRLNYEEGIGREAKKVWRIFSLQGTKVGQAMKVFRGSVLGDPWCFQPTKEWLVFLDKSKIPRLVNPLSGVKIKLPLAPYVGDDFLLHDHIIKPVLLSHPTRTRDFTIVVE